ncbi:MAG: Vitamin B12-binding protein [Gammaproteobacteria bacterium]|nr:Vitamin B12-binding protein [Gammaproteobacteria bacterium]
MRSFRFRRFLALTGLLAVSGAAWPLAVKDDRGVTVTLEAPAKRVVSLAPSITELVFAVGAGDRLIAVSEFSDYPPPARKLPRVANAFSVNVEKLLVLEPDLVISWQSGVNPRVSKRLESIGIPVFVLEPREIGDVPRTLRRVGRLLGAGKAADDQARAFARSIDGIRDQYADRDTVRVFYQVARHPLMTLNGRHMVTALLELCGGSNVFHRLTPIAPVVNREQVLARDPEVILISSTIRRSADLIDFWFRYPSISAVRLTNVYLVESDLINRQTPRLVEGARQICNRLDRARAKLAGQADRRE